MNPRRRRGFRPSGGVTCAALLFPLATAAAHAQGTGDPVLRLKRSDSLTWPAAPAGVRSPAAPTLPDDIGAPLRLRLELTSPSATGVRAPATAADAGVPPPPSPTFTAEPPISAAGDPKPPVSEPGLEGETEAVAPDLATPSPVAFETGAPEDLPEPAGETPSGRRWGLAPIRWGGRLTEDLRWTDSDNGVTQTGSTTGLTLRATSFIRQPWIALVNGRLTLAYTTQDSESDNTYSTDSTTVTGGAELSLFSYSRFPFLGSFEVSDSRTSGDFTTTDFRSTRISLRQEYRPPKGPERYNVAYDRSVLDGLVYGDDTVDALSFGFSRFGPHHVWLADASLSRNERERTADRTDYVRASLRHSYRPDAPLNVESLASIDDRETLFDHVGAAIGNRSRFVQLSSNAIWQPRTQRPTIVTGGVRYFGVQASTEAEMTDLYNVNGSVNYTLSPNASLSAGVTWTHAPDQATNGDVVSANANANYRSTRIQWGNLGYGWHAGSSLTGQWSDALDNTSLGLFLGHTLSRLWRVSDANSVNLDLGQDLSANEASGEGVDSSTTLNHTANLYWRYQPTDAGMAYFGLNGTDSRTRGDTESQFQMINLQANGQIAIGRYASLSSNITLQQTREETETTTPDEEDWKDSAYGSVTFNHFRFLGVRNLRYTLEAYVNTLGIETTRQLGNVDAPRERIQKSLDQRLDYRIGRLDVQLIHRIVDTDDLRTSTVWLRLGRDFGDF